MNAILGDATKRLNWKIIVISALAFWLSGSLILDGLIMPSFYASGMMVEPNFATSGYSIFWLFNRVEILCAAVALTGILAGSAAFLSSARKGWAIAFAVTLLSISLLYTYALTPEMSALGLQLDLFTLTPEIPEKMDQMHQGYWLLEVLKLVSTTSLISICSKN
jgi:hypothetical protein